MLEEIKISRIDYLRLCWENSILDNYHYDEETQRFSQWPDFEAFIENKLSQESIQYYDKKTNGYEIESVIDTTYYGDHRQNKTFKFIFTNDIEYSKELDLIYNEFNEYFEEYLQLQEEISSQIAI